MRQRKAPVIPAILLVASLALAGYFNYQNSPEAKKAREQAAQPKVAESRQTESKEDLAKRLGSGAPSSNMTATANGQGGSSAAPAPLAPSIESRTDPNMPPQVKKMIEEKKRKGIEPGMEKPVPNDSATSGQWYTEETPK